MKSSKNKRIFHWFDGVLWENPVLALGLGVPFAVICTTTLKNAAALSVAMIFTTVPVYLTASLAGKYIPQWLRIVVYSLLGAAALIPARILAYQINPTLDDSLGIYFALMAVNPALLIPALSRRITEEKPWFALLHALCCSLGFAGVLFGIALIREPLGSGTFWGHLVTAPVRLSPIQYSFGGFLLLGYFAAAYQLLARLFLLLSRRISELKTKKAELLKSRQRRAAQEVTAAGTRPESQKLEAENKGRKRRGSKQKAGKM